MASSEVTGKQPDTFQQNKHFVSPSIQNLLSDSLYEESGVAYSYWKTFRPGLFTNSSIDPSTHQPIISLSINPPIHQFIPNNKST